MGAVERFCDRAMLLEHGRVVDIDEPSSIARQYNQHNFRRTREEGGAPASELPSENPAVEVINAVFESPDGETALTAQQGEPGTVRMTVHFTEEVVDPIFAISLVNESGHPVFSTNTDAQRIEVLNKLQAAGVKWVRIDLGWASLQESGPNSYSKWYVDLADSVVNAARARGIDVLATLWTSPSWANGGGAVRVPPTDAGDYARAAQWAAAHFRGRVAAWEIWNEPNLSDFFSGTPAQYAALLRAAYPAVKAGDPNAQVVLGGPSSNDVAWLRQVYAAGIKDSFDIMSTHPYQGMADAPPELADDGQKWNLTHVAAVHDLMVQQGDGAKSIWFTEFGWSSHDNPSGVENWNRGVSLQQQGDYLVRAHRYAATNYPYVRAMFWYKELAYPGSPDVHEEGYALLNSDLTERPVYWALKSYLVG